MNDSPQSSNVIFLKRNSVVPMDATRDQPDPRTDREWVMRAMFFYGPDNADPDAAYAEFAERQQQSDVAS